MAKTKEELEMLKKECSELSKKMKELSLEEMKEISGGTFTFQLLLWAVNNVEDMEYVNGCINYNLSKITSEELQLLKQEFKNVFGVELVIK